MLKDNTYTELSKQVFLMILKESKIIMVPEKKVAVVKDEARKPGNANRKPNTQ